MFGGAACTSEASDPLVVAAVAHVKGASGSIQGYAMVLVGVPQKSGSLIRTSISDLLVTKDRKRYTMTPWLMSLSPMAVPPPRVQPEAPSEQAAREAAQTFALAGPGFEGGEARVYAYLIRERTLNVPKPPEREDPAG